MTRNPESPDGASLSPLRRVCTRLSRTVKQSVADETEAVWVEKRSRRVAFRIPDAEEYDRHSHLLEVRVRCGNRIGRYRTGESDRGEMSNAIRAAIANSRANAPGSVPPMVAPQTSDDHRSLDLFDEELDALTPRAARHWLAQRLHPDEAALLEWSSGQVALQNSHGLERRQRATSCFLQIRSGEGPGAGFATGATRSFAELDALEIEEKARRRRTEEAPDDHHGGAVPLLLAPEATIELVELLNHQAFSAAAYREGFSFVREHLGTQVFDSRFDLIDDGTSARGLPFPFDLEGRSKRPVPLVARGVPRTPTIDSGAAQEFQLEPTGHSVGGGDAYALNLFMEPGQASAQELLDAADGGLWVSRLERIECFDLGRMLLRTVARGVRRIQSGRLAQPLPDLVWNDSLLRVFSRLEAVGSERSVKVSSDGILGGTSAPSIVLPGVDDLTATRT